MHKKPKGAIVMTIQGQIVGQAALETFLTFAFAAMDSQATHLPFERLHQLQGSRLLSGDAIENLP